MAISVGARDGLPLVALGTVGFVGPKWRSLRGGEIDQRIELDMDIRRESEGAAVLDASGRGAGMAVFGPRGRVLVIPGSTIERVAPLLRDKGRVARGYLGPGLQLAPVDGGVGAIVMSVDQGGPGASAGVRQGDVIIAVDGAPISGVRALVRSLGPDSVGRSLRFELRRGGEPLALDIVVAERPA